MANAEQVKGITTNRRTPVVTPKPTNFERGRMSFSQALADNTARKEANDAAEAARIAVMKKHGLLAKEETASVKSAEETALELKRKELAKAEADLKADPTSAKLKKQVGKLNTEIDQLEDEIG